ncbi:MAG: hypothetical protein E3J56_12635 [Candidatus Aminicenantes bacterium]|nr:MAG: hypothetical protein E3J56_12635 [Candidatus Aminicenantes bacterium]
MFKKKQKYLWQVEESLDCMMILDEELKRLHASLEGNSEISSQIMDQIAKITDYMLMVSKRVAGMEW